MIHRRVVSMGIFTALALAAGLTSAPASAFVTREVHPVPFDGKPGGPGYQPNPSGMSCMVVGASCNKGPMPPWMSGGRWEHGERRGQYYSGRDGGFPQQGWPKPALGKPLGGPL